ncbi:MAG: hypothetical protein HYY40_11630 [Bacteroidetes bacterium]|nr:hypothetical protein [Bacteroidota bacterium]
MNNRGFVFRPLGETWRAGLALSLIMICNQAVLAQNSPGAINSIEKTVEAGFTCLYGFDFSGADSIRMTLQKKYPRHPWSYLFAVNYYWWMIISTGNDTSCRAPFYSSLDSAEKYLKPIAGKRKAAELPDDCLYSYIYLYAYRSRIELLDKKIFSSVMNAKDCIDFIRASFGKETRYPRFGLTSGIYFYGTGYAKKHYRWLRPALLVIPAGDTEKGKKFLVQASMSDDVIVFTEGIYFLMKIFYEFEPNLRAASIYASILCRANPSNLLYRYYYIRILQALQNSKDAEAQMAVFYSSLQSNKTLSPEVEKYFTKLYEELKNHK